MTDYSTEIDELSDEELEAKLKALAEAAEKRKVEKREAAVIEVREAIQKYDISPAQVFGGFITKINSKDTWTKEELITLFVRDSTGQVQEIVTTPSSKKSKAAKGDSKANRPKAIYYNAQAAEGEQLYIGGRITPSWFDKDNEAVKAKFAVKDYAQQVELMKKYDKDSTKVEQWLAANPTITSSK